MFIFLLYTGDEFYKIEFWHIIATAIAWITASLAGIVLSGSVSDLVRKPRWISPKDRFNSVVSYAHAQITIVLLGAIQYMGAYDRKVGITNMMDKIKMWYMILIAVNILMTLLVLWFRNKRTLLLGTIAIVIYFSYFHR